MPGRSSFTSSKPSVRLGGRWMWSCASDATSCTRPSRSISIVNVRTVCPQRPSIDPAVIEQSVPPSTSLRSRPGSRWNSGQRSGWASTDWKPRSASPAMMPSMSTGFLPYGLSSRMRRPEPSESRASWASSRSLALAQPISAPGRTRSGSRSRCRRSLKRSTRGSISLGSTSKSARMCGVATMSCVPASTAARAIDRLKSRFAGPSSRPGRMWQWRSITADLLRRLEHRSDGHDEYLEIEPQGPVLDVEVVELDPVRQRRLPAQPVHLGPAGDPRLHAVAVLVAVDAALEQLHELGPLGTRADDAHLAAQDVEELRQLVDRGASHQLADRGAAIRAL